MLNLLRCYLSGRHDYGVGCEPGTIFLRCVHCGRRSAGWTVDHHSMGHAPQALPAATPRPVPVPVPVARRTATPPRTQRHQRLPLDQRPPLAVVAASPATPVSAARVIPFRRSAAH